MDLNIDVVITPKQDIYDIEGNIILTPGTSYVIKAGLFDDITYIVANDGTDFWLMQDVDGNLFSPVGNKQKQFNHAMGIV